MSFINLIDTRNENINNEITIIRVNIRYTKRREIDILLLSINIIKLSILKRNI